MKNKSLAGVDVLMLPLDVEVKTKDLMVLLDSLGLVERSCVCCWMSQEGQTLPSLRLFVWRWVCLHRLYPCSLAVVYLHCSPCLVCTMTPVELESSLGPEQSIFHLAVILQVFGGVVEVEGEEIGDSQGNPPVEGRSDSADCYRDFDCGCVWMEKIYYPDVLKGDIVVVEGREE
jgi:hypothetical protein